ncbi:MAG TPA: FHA domain-containing protein [Thermoanaerobaculia bacterium]|nr:FHA domain-containing protein [Thermoanaerobaculia bacterium]
MIIECTSCHSKYQYNEDRFERKPSKKIKCAKCGTVFEIFNPAFAAPAPAAPAVGDQTFHKKPEAKKPVEESTTEARVPQSSTGKTTAALALPPGKRLSLAIIDGPDAGNVFRIEKPRVTVGRSGADMNLNDTEASRQHAAVEVRDTAYIVLDLGSTNGTLVDGVKISGPTELTDKGEFVVGNSTIMLIVTEDV